MCLPVLLFFLSWFCCLTYFSILEQYQLLFLSFFFFSFDPKHLKNNWRQLVFLGLQWILCPRMFHVDQWMPFDEHHIYTAKMTIWSMLTVQSTVAIQNKKADRIWQSSYTVCKRDSPHEYNTLLTKELKQIWINPQMRHEHAVSRSTIVQYWKERHHISHQ